MCPLLLLLAFVCATPYRVLECDRLLVGIHKYIISAASVGCLSILGYVLPVSRLYLVCISLYLACISAICLSRALLCCNSVRQMAGGERERDGPIEAKARVQGRGSPAASSAGPTAPRGCLRGMVGGSRPQTVRWQPVRRTLLARAADRWSVRGSFFPPGL